MGLSTFLGVETALRGILAQQRAIDVTGHNIANASTPGYSRQVAVLETTPALPDVPAGLLGTGVDVSQYQRVRSNYIDVQLRAQTMLKGSAESLQDGLNQVELALNEPSDTGLSSLLSNYWAAWQNLSNAPDDLATRQALAQSASSLADGFNSLASQLTTIQTQTQQQQTDTVTQINSIGTQIAALNGSIKAAELAGQQPNDLLDQRDQLLDQLNELVNTTFGPVNGSTAAGTPGALGSIDVTVGGSALKLVNDTTATTLTLADLTGITSGKLNGMQAVLDSIYNSTPVPPTGYLATLNDIAAALASQTNTQHALGVDMNGAAGGAFFTVTAGSEASTIKVNPALTTTPQLIAAAAAGAGPGDATNALAIADLQRSAIVGTAPNTATVDQAYTSLVTQIGSDSQLAQQKLANATSLTDALTNQRASVSGVSLDEEMAQLLQFQRGYQASARALSAMDDMIDQLINRTGRVGL